MIFVFAACSSGVSQWSRCRIVPSHFRAFVNGRFALPAGPAPAEVGRVHPGGFHRLQQALSRADGDGLAAGRQFHRKGQAGAGSDEFFRMQRLFRPAHAFGGRQHPSNHSLRTADVKMRTNRLILQDLLQVYRLLQLVEIAVDLGRMRLGQAVHIGSQGLRSRRIMQLELAAQMAELADLRQERRDPDPARDHQVLLGPVVQREQVDRVGERHLHARRDMPVHEQ